MLDENDPSVRRAALFTNGRSQAVRIPKDMEFEGSEVLLKREGDVLFVEQPRQRMSPREIVEWLRQQPPLDEDEDWLVGIDDMPPLDDVKL